MEGDLFCAAQHPFSIIGKSYLKMERNVPAVDWSVLNSVWVRDFTPVLPFLGKGINPANYRRTMKRGKPE